MATDLFVREGVTGRTRALPLAPQVDGVWGDLLAYAQCAAQPLDQAFKESLKTVVDAVREGTLTDDEAQDLIGYLVAAYAERQVTGMVNHSLESIGRPRARWWHRLRRARSESVCPVCGNRG